jgi:hypothetical protein
MVPFSTLRKRWQRFQRRSAWKRALPYFRQLRSNQFRSSPDGPEFASTLQLIQLVPAVRHLARFLAGSFPFTGVSFMWPHRAKLTRASVNGNRTGVKGKETLIFANS